MSNYIFKLLDTYQPDLTKNLKDIEGISSQPAIDIKLDFLIRQNVVEKLSSLNLRADDGGSLIYQALIDEMIQINKLISPNITSSIDHGQFITNLTKWFHRKKLIKKGWFVKDQVLRKMLQRTPPMNTVANFGYHSVNSFLRRENLAEIMVAVSLFENNKWHQSWAKACQDLKPNNFQLRRIRIISLYKFNTYKSFFVENPDRFYFMSPIYGSILPRPLIIPKEPAPILMTILHLLEGIRQARLFSTWFKIHQPVSDFGAVVSQTLRNGWPTVFKIANQSITWPIMAYYFQKTDPQEFANLLDPHIASEDLQLKTPIRSLGEIVPIFDKYEKNAHCGVVRSDSVQPISFNLLDLTIDTQSGMTYSKHSVRHFKDQLINELWSHYLELPIFNRQLIEFLNCRSV